MLGLDETSINMIIDSLDRSKIEAFISSSGFDDYDVNILSALISKAFQPPERSSAPTSTE